MKSKENKKSKQYLNLLTRTIQGIQFELLATYQIQDKVVMHKFYDVNDRISGRIVGVNVNKNSKKINSYWVKINVKTVNSTSNIRGMRRVKTLSVYDKYLWTPLDLKLRSDEVLIEITTKELDSLNKKQKK